MIDPQILRSVRTDEEREILKAIDEEGWEVTVSRGGGSDIDVLRAEYRGFPKREVAAHGVQSLFSSLMRAEGVVITRSQEIQVASVVEPEKARRIAS